VKGRGTGSDVTGTIQIGKGKGGVVPVLNYVPHYENVGGVEI
jgi:hypothetical protein